MKSTSATAWRAWSVRVDATAQCPAPSGGVIADEAVALPCATLGFLQAPQPDVCTQPDAHSLNLLSTFALESAQRYHYYCSIFCIHGVRDVQACSVHCIPKPFANQALSTV